ncbi:uncharacterized protein LOC116208726 [Punica granatum]|uniref:Uncharacterized protein n=2 Tax=Punica granatum TaxID=22663 RepID=A0A218VW73_PUNGR|nr:uncharacterized protein LOC116208726 [Punica granatum]OWM64646.1 hypothetical protein CDL15_Pgr020613 [Punica granatum]PKI39357.1 hypothetical protein CRG98_040223 [Punica granatum]
MALLSPSQTLFLARQSTCNHSPGSMSTRRLVPGPEWRAGQSSYGMKQKRPLTVVAAFGDVSADGTTYLFAGAATVALLGTAFPILFSRKDLCPDCDGAGFIRKSGVTLRANAARKDQAQIVCPRCNGLGKLDQIDK